MNIYVNNIFSESRDGTDVYQDNMDVLWGNYTVETDQKWKFKRGCFNNYIR